MAEVKLTEEQLRVLAERNPDPVAGRTGSKKGTLGVPPVPDSANPTPTEPTVSDLQAKVTALEAEKQKFSTREAELVEAAKKKDVALEEKRLSEAKLVEELKQAREPRDDEPLEDRLKRQVQELAAKEIERQKTEIEPLLAEARQSKRERDEALAASAFGAENVEKYKEEALQVMQKHPTLSLAEAMNQVVPRAEPAGTTPATPPATHVEGSRAPAPEPPKNVAERMKELQAKAAAAAKSGNVAEAKALQQSLVKLQVFGR